VQRVSRVRGFGHHAVHHRRLAGMYGEPGLSGEKDDGRIPRAVVPSEREAGER
jgi:hypothetical protein